MFKLEVLCARRTWGVPHHPKLRLRRPERTGAALFTICKNQVMPGKKTQMQLHRPDIRNIAIWRKKRYTKPIQNDCS